MDEVELTKSFKSFFLWVSSAVVQKNHRTESSIKSEAGIMLRLQLWSIDLNIAWKV